jgi:hypothetical protein
MGPGRDRRLPGRLRLAAALALCAALAAPAWAEEAAESKTSPTGEEAAEIETPPGAEMQPVPLGPRSGVRLYGEETISVLADFGPADVSEFRSGLRLRAVAPLTESLALRAVASGHGSFFDYSGDEDGLEVGLGGIDLFERLYGAQFGLGAIYRLPYRRTFFGVTPAWSLFGEGRAQAHWESGASLSDAVKGTGSLGIGFQLEPKLEIALGVSVASRIDEGGVSVSPVVGFRWRFCEGMHLASQGSGLLFSMDLTPELELQLRGSYESDRYRLVDGGAPPRDLTLRQREAPVLLVLRWSPTPHWRLMAGAGSVVYQKWKVEVDDDGPSSKVSAGPAALTWLRVEYRF